MPQQVYEIQGPDGKTYEIQSDHVPTRQEVSTALSRMNAYNQPDPMAGERARAIARSQGLGIGLLRPPVVDELGRPLNGSTEPGTYWGGFAKSLKDQLLNATVNNPALQSAARPQTTGDLMSVVMAPTDATRSGLPAAMNAVRDLRQQAREGPVGVAVKQMMKKVGVDADAMEMQTINNELRAKRMELQAARMKTRQMARTAPTPADVPRTAPVAEAPPRTGPGGATASATNARGEVIVPTPTDPEVVAGPPSVSGPQGVPTQAAAPEATMRAESASAANPRRPPTAASAPRAASSGGSIAKAPDLTKAQPETIAGLLDRIAGRQSMTLTAQERDAAVTMVRQGAKPSDLIDAIAAYRKNPSGGAADDAAAALMDKLGLPTNPDVGGPQHARGVTGKWKATE